MTCLPTGRIAAVVIELLAQMVDFRFQLRDVFFEYDASLHDRFESFFQTVNDTQILMVIVANRVDEIPNPKFDAKTHNIQIVFDAYCTICGMWLI
ncbi:MAG: hypothetical protein LBD85_00330 [Oscillospiraceae bacterium]|jgi:hypothetical protein|nr:hypothetical protein [Oscillospiraceae bacterium]